MGLMGGGEKANLEQPIDTAQLNCVLLSEDDPALRRLVARTLNDHGYIVISAATQFDFATCDSQSCKTTNAELSPGVIDGITKRLPSAEISNEAGE